MEFSFFNRPDSIICQNRRRRRRVSGAECNAYAYVDVYKYTSDECDFSPPY
jgi:hypothetical protein